MVDVRGFNPDRCQFCAQLPPMGKFWLSLDMTERLMTKVLIHNSNKQRSGRASDSKLRGPGFDPHRHHRVLSLSKTH